ncbi:MAG: hypothetical protein M3N41_10840 [Acidobacteriota bacterium]|nr:hypothetical protein [Acidobacteriota bacterium]
MNSSVRSRPFRALAQLAIWIAGSAALLQGQGGPPPEGATAPPKAAKAAAPIDLTGYWVSLVTEDWMYRMVTPPKGDYSSVPLNAAGRKVADDWDPAKDEAGGEQCKSYGAAAIVRVPGRLHIAWADENSLKIDTDSGEQTRVFHFNSRVPPTTESTLQGYSAAEWQKAGGNGRGPHNPGGSLQVTTTHLKPGYLRKNGVPYSSGTVLTEYYNRATEPNGDSWLIVTTIVEDPQYLRQPFVTSTHFKYLPTASGWDPMPCSTR